MSSLETRLARQLASRGKKGAKDLAREILVERGHVKPDGSLTRKGKKRDDLGPDGRAKDRAAKASEGRHHADDYEYDPHTNRATLK